MFFFFFFSSRRRHTRSDRDWSSDVCSSDLSRNFGSALIISVTVKSAPKATHTARNGQSLIPAIGARPIERSEIVLSSFKWASKVTVPVVIVCLLGRQCSQYVNQLSETNFYYLIFPWRLIFVRNYFLNFSHRRLQGMGGSLTMRILIFRSIRQGG